MSGLSWQRDPYDELQPHTAPRLWRGVAYALGIELCALAIVLPLAWGLGWIG